MEESAPCALPPRAAQPYHSAESRDHGARAQCKGCDFCVHGVPCDAHDADDADIEKCEPFCNRLYADTHCDLCKCRGCSYCLGRIQHPPAPPKPPSPPRPPPDGLATGHAALPPPPANKRAPEAPRFVTASAASCGSVTITWQVPFDKGFPIDQYEVLAKRPGQTSALLSQIIPLKAVHSIPTHDAGTSARVRHEGPSQKGLPGAGGETRRAAEASAELTGLAPATTYQLRVRAHSDAGWGLLSSAADATTALPLRAPLTPTATPRTVGSTCTTLLVEAPPLRSGCSGDERLVMEVREARWASVSSDAGWQPWDKHHSSLTGSGSEGDGKGQGWVPSSGQVSLSSISSYKAYQTRVRGHNAIGMSVSAGPPSAPMLSGSTPRGAMDAAPAVIAEGPANVRLAWVDATSGGVHCRPGQTWEVLALRSKRAGDQGGAAPQAGAAGPGMVVADASKALKDAEDAWETVASDLTGTTAALPSMRCPSGCTFRLHALNISGWDVYSNASLRVVTPPEPSRPPGSLRIELAAVLETGVDEFAAAIASAVGVGPDRVRLAYTYQLRSDGERGAAMEGAVLQSEPPQGTVEPAVTYAVLDLLPGQASAATDAGEGTTAASNAIDPTEEERRETPEGIAQTLAGLMAAHSRLLWGHSATQGIVPAFGLLQIHLDGTHDHLWSKHSASDGDHALIAIARRITAAVVLCSILVACMVSCSSHLGHSASPIPSRTADADLGADSDESGDERERLRSAVD